jgi:iron-sulfur cluster protein
LSLQRKRRKKAKAVLQDGNLQKALTKASSQHFKKFISSTESIPWEEYKKEARSIREECLEYLPQLIQKFSEEAKKAGAQVHQAETSAEALTLIEGILHKNDAKLIVKAKSMVSEEIGLNSYLEEKGYRVVETDLGEWITQLAGERPSHITAPALHKTKEDIAKLLSLHLGKDIPPDPEKIVKIAREELRQCFLEADVGISGANLAVAESGTLVIVSNEGNARLVTSLPPVHIALITTEKFVDSLEQATLLVKTLITASSGMKTTSYVSFITGTSRTTDIEKDLVTGVHGPQEVHIVILDNGRLQTRENKDLKKVLTCLKCGGCMLVCPVFQSLGGHVFGGPVYPGGVGLLLTAMTGSLEDSAALLDFCSDCKKCEEFCPVSIPTGELILHLKAEKGAKPWDRALSRLFREKSLFLSGAKLLSIIQKAWKKDGYIKPLPFAWARGKSFPSLNVKKHKPQEKKPGPKILFFEGCLVKLFFPEIRESVCYFLSRLNFSVVLPQEQVCCGAPSLHLGQKNDVLELAEKNLSVFIREDPDIILTVCPTGNSMLKKIYPRIAPEFESWREKIFDFTEFVVKKGYFPKKEIQRQRGEIFYHYPCHYLYDLKLKEEPIKLLKALGFLPKEESEPFSCCGFCGIFSMKNPEISAHLWGKKRKKITESGVSLIATDCPGCLFQFRGNLNSESDAFRVFHTAEILAQCSAEGSSIPISVIKK